MCKDCINFIYDNSTGQSDCKQFDNMTEKEIEQYFTEDEAGCPHHNRPLTAKQVNLMFEVMEKVRLKNITK